MHDLDTIKRVNRNPSKRFERDNPAPQPTRAESASYDFRARRRVLNFSVNMQSPAMEREPLEKNCHVTDEETPECSIVASFYSVSDAEKYIASLPDAAKVARGGYGIDHPCE